MKHQHYYFILAILMSMVSSMATAYDAEIDGIYYTLSGTEATVVSGELSGGVPYIGFVTIPSSVIYNGKTYEVTSIGDNAFWRGGDSYDLTSVTIPESVTSIGYKAFCGCYGLTSINIPNSVMSIGDYAFEGCKGLTSITIPESVTRIGRHVFQRCFGLTSVTIPNSVTSIGYGAFGGCKGLTSITIPKGVTVIEDLAFSSCSSLTSVTIPESVTNISGSAFRECSSLTSINVEKGNTIYDSRDNCNAIVGTETNVLIAGCQNTIIPNSVTWIGEYAFYGCSGLTSVTIPNSVIVIDYEAFYGCSGLTSVAIPEGVVFIYSRAFLGCSGLTSVTIPESVTYIDESAFTGCSSLTSIIIPESVTKIDGVPWYACSSLASIVVKEGNTKYDSRNECNAIIETASNKLIAGCMNTIIPESVTCIGEKAFWGCSGLTSITIPNSVTSIGSSAFFGCSGLTSITIPEGVTIIGDWVFGDCSGLTSITIPNSVTEINDYAFSGCYSLNYVKMGMTTPPNISYRIFDGSNYRNATLCVPRGSKAAYQAVDVWKDFKEIKEYDCEVVVDNQTIAVGGSTMMEVRLNNFSSDLVGFQMDITLPEGVSIDKTGCSLSSRITDDDQVLTIGKLEDGKYRLTSASLSLTPISGNDGALLTLKLTAENGCVGGQATISNIRFSTSESEKIIMDDASFDINILYNLIYMIGREAYKITSVAYGTALTLEPEPTKEGHTFGGWSEIPATMPNYNVVVTGAFYLYGDVNTDEEVDVLDVVDIARYVVAMPSVNFRARLADLNLDNYVNLGDAVVLVNHIVGDQNFVKAWNAPSQPIANDVLYLSESNSTLSLNLDNEREYTAFQFDLYVPGGAEVSQMLLNVGRKQGHQLIYNKVEDGHYRVAALSTQNHAFNGNAGELLNITLSGVPGDEVRLCNIRFFDAEGRGYMLEDVEGTITTGITRPSSAPSLYGEEIYDLQGRKRAAVQRGINIVGGKKIIKE